MNRSELISSFVLLAVAAFVLVHSLGLGIGTLSSPGPGFLLFLSSSVLGVLSISLVLMSYGKRKQNTVLSDLWRGLKWRSVLLAVMALFLFAVLLPKIGFLLASFVFMLILFGLGRMKPWVIVTNALIVAALSYLIFGVALRVPFP